MDKAAIAYVDCTMAIASRVGQLKAAARGVRSGPTNAQKAAMLVAKWARLYTDTKKRLDKLVLEVTAELPVDHLAVANSLEDELARIKLSVSHLEGLTLEIQVADVDSYVTAEQTQEAK